MPTEATPVALGTPAPTFALADVVTGRHITFGSLLADEPAAAGVLVLFLCVHCPYVKHVEAILAQLAADFAHRIAFVALSANDPAQHPEDGPDGMRAQALRCAWPFPYLFDEAQDVARGFDAACTPECYLFTRDRRLVYHGRIDATRPARIPGAPTVGATGEDLRAALDALTAGRPALAYQSPSIGCSIKWRA